MTPTPEERCERLLNNANEAARHVLRVYLIFLLIDAYISIIIGSTTDEQLLRVSRITLPLLNVGIPILAFYILAPWIVLLLHFNLLLQLYLLATKLHAFDLTLNDIGPTVKRDAYRDQLFPFLFSHMLIGHHHGRLTRWLLKLAIWVTVILLPLLLLVAAQTRFLPYHSEPITWSHRAAVGLEVFLLWTLWPMIATRRGNTKEWWRQASAAPLRWFPIRRVIRLLAWKKLSKLQVVAAWSHRAETQRASGLTFLLTTTPVLLLCALTVVVIPGERMDNIIAQWLFDGCNSQDHPPVFFHRNLCLANDVFVTGKPSSEIVAALRNNDKKEQAEARRKIIRINLARRDLRFAYLFRAILPKAVLREAQLQGVDLSRVQLQGATLRNAQLQGAKLSRAQLQGAFLSSAQLQGVTLRNAQLQGVTLRNAQLQGANLSNAQLQGANLSNAQLQGTDLSDAQLSGANLESAYLRLSNLLRVSLEVLSQADYDTWKTALSKERQDLVMKRVGQPASLEQAEIQDAWCDNKLRTTVKGCLPDTDRSAYDKKLTVMLADLGCEDVYIARGITHYRLNAHRPSWFDRDLAFALLEKADQPDCKGIQELPQDEKDDLRKIVKAYDDNTTWEIYGFSMRIVH
ncbi:MAG: pentapeptide repeat-containing protein [Candidatus Binatia bacterium]